MLCLQNLALVLVVCCWPRHQVDGESSGFICVRCNCFLAGLNESSDPTLLKQRRAFNESIPKALVARAKRGRAGIALARHLDAPVEQRALELHWWYQSVGECSGLVLFHMLWLDSKPFSGLAETSKVILVALRCTGLGIQ
eukprot:s2470_g3.t1